MDTSERTKQPPNSSNPPNRRKGPATQPSSASEPHFQDPSRSSSAKRSEESQTRANGKQKSKSTSSSAPASGSAGPSTNAPQHHSSNPLRSEDQQNGPAQTHPTEQSGPLPTTESVPRSQSQKRKDRRKNAELRRLAEKNPDSDAIGGTQSSNSQNPSVSSVSASSGSNASSAPSKNVSGPKPSAKKSSGAGYVPNGGGSGHREGKGRRGAQDAMQMAKEDILYANAPRKLQNLSGFGDEFIHSSSSANREMLASSAEYVPSSQRDKSVLQEKQPRVNGPRASRPHLDASQATEGQTELASKIIQELIGNRYECDICFNVIVPSVATWSCSNCFCILHVFCAKRWAKSARDPNAPADAALRWHCPKCRHGQDGVPNSWCFCGKVKKPAYDPMKVPHSCGDLCLRPRSGTSCPHTCPLQCHPGPCPPCASMGPLRHCWCGRTSYRLRCGLNDDGQSCGHECRKSLNCGRHQCQSSCHSGQCAPCSAQVQQTCYCGKTTTTRTCGASDELEDTHSGQSRFFSCHDACDQLLDCGKHRCQRTCHTGPCQPCQLQPNLVKTCGCGAKDLLSLTDGQPRVSCLDPIPSCKGVCNKMRECGHRCAEVCHPGACGPCDVEIQLPCRCHTLTKPMKCHEVYPNQKKLTSEFTCERTCGRQKACGKHTCSTRCCPSLFDKTDPEGNHVCRVTCNKRLACGKHLCRQTCHKGRCGRCLEATFNDIVCACGKTIQEAPVSCGTPPLVCPHPCSKQRPCGHPATTHTCHEGECPPCLIPMEQPCAGGHTLMVNIPCYKRNMSCGVACNKPMACGLHNCKKMCHPGSCEAPSAEGVVLPPGSKPSCGQVCRTPLYSCEHSCPAQCHPGQPCPTAQCLQPSKVSCECGINTSEIPCPGKEKPVLPCTSACEAAKRQKRLAEAFGIYGTATSAPRYPDLLINIACVAPMFITRLEKWLEDFVKNTNVQRQDLPPLDRVQRQCVHELAKFYGIGTESSGSEDRKQRAVTLIKRRDCKPPSVSLTTVANVTGLHDSASSKTAGSSGMISPYALDSAPSCTLHIYDLHKGILTNTIHSFLSGFPNEYTLQWVDDENCLAIFKDSNRMQRALNALQPRGTFKVKPYQDIIPEPVSSGMVSLGSTASAWKTTESTSSIFSAAPAASSSPSPSSNVAPSATKPKGAAEKPTSAWGRPISSGTANAFSVLGDSPSSASTTRTAVGRLGMWDYGEPEAKPTHTEATAVEITSPSSPEPESVPSSKPAVADWSELLDDEEEASSAPQ